MKVTKTKNHTTIKLTEKELECLTTILVEFFESTAGCAEDGAIESSGFKRELKFINKLEEELEK